MAETKLLAKFTDAELAAMVRNSCYAKNARFGEGPNDSRFLLVLAVPYGLDEDCESLPEAIEAFLSFCSEGDNNERQFQVYDHAAPQHYYEVSLEEASE